MLARNSCQAFRDAGIRLTIIAITGDVAYSIYHFSLTKAAELTGTLEGTCSGLHATHEFIQARQG